MPEGRPRMDYWYDKEAKQDMFWEEYNSYIQENQMTPYERKVLRKWVASGHSVYQSPGSKYYCDPSPMGDFLDTYRADRYISRELRGKTKVEKDAWLKDYFGWTEEPPVQPSTDELKKKISELEDDNYRLWEFIIEKGLWSEAGRYLAEHQDIVCPLKSYQ